MWFSGFPHEKRLWGPFPDDGNHESFASVRRELMRKPDLRYACFGRNDKGDVPNEWAFSRLKDGFGLGRMNIMGLAKTTALVGVSWRAGLFSGRNIEKSFRNYIHPLHAREPESEVGI